MILYVMDKDSFRIKGIYKVSSYSLKTDIDFDDSSTLVIADFVSAEDGDFALIKDESTREQVFFGICKENKVADSGNTLTLKQAEALFDTTIYKDNEDLIQSEGIEDYIVKAIEDNFTASGDDLMDMDFISVSASTHTPVAAKISTIVDTENGIFNLKTFLGNARQYYGVFLDFTPTTGKLAIDVNVREQDTLKVDTKLAEMMDLSETYSVDVLAKLIVKWALTEDDDPTTRTYYFLSDRTITDVETDTERVDGTVKTVYIQAETEDEMYENVTNEFKGNSYNHSITLKLRRDSRIYDLADFYVGRQCQILTEKAGTVESMVTETSQEGEDYLGVTFGKLPVTLTRKLRKGVK